MNPDKKVRGNAFVPERVEESLSDKKSGFMHSFGDVQVGNRQFFGKSCSFALSNPGHCPFGGACHACPPRMQAKLKIGQPGDKYEQEADRVADEVTRMPEPLVQRKGCVSCNDIEEEEIQTRPITQQITPLVQRQVEEEEEEEELLQPKSGHGCSREEILELPNSLNYLRGGSQQPDRTTLAFMNSRFGYDFRKVRVYSDGCAAKAARSVNAKAFTVGEDIVFGEGQYAPHTDSGKKLLAHELTHVLQQTGAAGRGRAAIPMLQRQMPRLSEDEREAQDAALLCNIPALCRIHSRSPAVVSDDRIRSVARRCHPGALSTLPPCLNPAFMLRPERFSGGAAPSAAPGRRGAGAGMPSIPSLGDFTTFSFRMGGAAVTVDLPSSVRVRLPVPLRGAGRIVFNFQAGSSGAFTFSIVLDGLRYIRVRAEASVDVASGMGRAGVTVTTTRTECHALNRAEGERLLRSKVNTLQGAIDAFRNPPAETRNDPIEQASRIGDVASGISDVYDAIQRIRSSCREVPMLSVGVRGQTPIREGTGESPSVGLEATLHF